MGDHIRYVRFGGCSVDLVSREFYRGAERISIQEKPFRLLEALLARPRDVIGREELCEALWPRGTYVEREAGLNTAVRKLRAVLRDALEADDVLETVPRVGYRLMVDPVVDDVQPVAGPGRAPAWRLGFALGVAAVAVFVVALLAVQPNEATTRKGEGLPASPAARTAYLEARNLLSRDHDIGRARELLREVVIAEPDLGAAYGYLAEASLRLAFRTGTPEDQAAARQSAEAAMGAAPGTATAERVNAMVALYFDWDLDAADAGLARAVVLDPDDPSNYLALAAHRSIIGRHEEAVAAARRAVALDPDSMLIRSDTGYFLLRAERYEEALQECELVLRIAPEEPFGHECLVRASRELGRVEEARAHAVHLLQAAGAGPADVAALRVAEDPWTAYTRWTLAQALAEPVRWPVHVAVLYASLGDRERALEWLEKASAERAPNLMYAPGRPEFRSLRGNERMRRLLERAGLGALAGSRA